MANHIVIMSSLYKSFGITSPNCELFPFGVTGCIYQVISISSSKNTIHVDDLVRSIPSERMLGLIGLFQGRNFALNPRQGLKISAFKDAHTPRAMADRELDDLAKYLLHIATTDNMETLNHKVGVKFQQGLTSLPICQDWKRIARALPPH